MDGIINEIKKFFNNNIGEVEITQVSDEEYRIQGKIRDLHFVYVINVNRLIYRLQCYHKENFIFTEDEAVGYMSRNFKTLQEVSFEIYRILKKYK